MTDDPSPPAPALPADAEPGQTRAPGLVGGSARAAPGSVAPTGARERSAARSLEGRVALVAGADGEGGGAIALLLARTGAKLALMDAGGVSETSGPGRGRRRREPSEALELRRSEIERAGGRAMVVGGDPDDMECALDAVRRVIEAWGAIDALVLDSTRRVGPSTGRLAVAARPYLGRNASLANVVRAADGANGRRRTALIEHASLRAAQPRFAHSALASMAREGVLAASVRGRDRDSTFARQRPGTGALRGLGRHLLLLHDGRPRTLAACLLHLALADAGRAPSAATVALPR